MSELKQREQEHEANALRINAGRKPKFGDMMRNPWAGESNPQRDGYFVRERRQGGRFNPGHYYEFTDKCGKFWETNAKYAFFIDTQPEATKPAQDLGAAILEQAAQACDQQADGTNGAYRTACLQCANVVRELRDAALASPADALVVGDRVDAELREALEELYYALPDIFPAAGYKRLQETGQWSSKTTWDLRGHTGEVKYRADDMQSVYAAMDRVRAAIQAQKDGHG